MPKKRITTRLIFLATCAVPVAGILALLLSLLAEEVRKILATYLGEDYFSVIAAGVIICIFILFFAYLYEKAEPEEIIAQVDPDLRKQLLTKLKISYDERLKEKMKGDMRLDISLKLKYTTTGTSLERVEKFFIIKQDEQIDDFDRLFYDYIERIKRLLILGEPGAGKSILLLRFALKLVKEAEKNINFPIPVILDLATWKKEDQTFKHWLEQNLPYIGGSFAISKEESIRLVKSNSLLLLLDGLDEIQEQFRNPCLKELQIYLRKLRNSRKETLPEVILCSRISEYLSADDAPVFATVEIQPLQPKDVEAILQSMAVNNDESAIELQNVLKEYTHLYTAITSAFFLHILLNLYTQENKRLCFISDSKEILQKEIIEAYIQNELSKLSDFPLDKIKKWLGWLAWKTKYVVGIGTFELADLQPQWAKREYIFNGGFGLISGLVFGPVGCLVFNTVRGPTNSLVFGLVNGLFNGLIFSIIFVLASDPLFTASFVSLRSFLSVVLAFILVYGLVGLVYGLINPIVNRDKHAIATKEIQRISFKNAQPRALGRIFLSSLSFGLASSLICGLGISLMFGLINVTISTGDSEFKDLASLLIEYLILSLVFGLIYICGSALIFGVVSGLTNIFLVTESFPRIDTAYKRLLAQFWRDIFYFAMIFSLITWLLSITLMNSNIYDDSFIAVSFFAGALASILMSPIFRHFFLRLILVSETTIPKKLVAFLDLVSENSGLMTKNGGQWRFQHQLIHDSLANWFEKNHSHLLRQSEVEKSKSSVTC